VTITAPTLIFRVQDSHDSTVRLPLPPRFGSVLAVVALSGAALYGALFSISDLRHTIPAYAFTINALNHVTQLLTLDFLVHASANALYGEWNNSLGPILDAIHIAFDCMVIAMGLFASVMSGWEKNGRFTYRYGRVETDR
jgi:hypothetical protein